MCERERERERERREYVREKEDRDVGGTERQECVRGYGKEREISFAKNKEYRKAKSFIWMFVLKTIHTKDK